MNQNSMRQTGRQTGWTNGWQDHERQQLQRMAQLPLPVKIAWLEEAQKTAEQLQKQAHKPAHENS